MAEMKRKNAGTAKGKKTEKKLQPEDHDMIFDKKAEDVAEVGENGNEERKNEEDKPTSKDGKDPKNILRELAEEGREKGMLTYREIEDAFERVDITPDQIEKVYEALEKMGVEIVAENIEEEFEDLQFIDDIEEEDIDITIPEGISIDDPVRMYLK